MRVCSVDGCIFDRGVVAELRANGGLGFGALAGVCCKHVPLFIDSKRDVALAEDMFRAHS